MRTARAAIFHDLGLARAESKLQKRKLSWWGKLKQPETRPVLKIQTHDHSFWGPCGPGRQTKDLRGCVKPILKELAVRPSDANWKRKICRHLRIKNKQSITEWCKAYKSLDMLIPNYVEGQPANYLKGTQPPVKRSSNSGQARFL